jgi:hypothetical protein
VQSDGQGSRLSYVGAEALLKAAYAPRVLDQSVPASLLRGTCAVQTAAGRRGSILGTVLDEAACVIVGVISCVGTASCMLDVGGWKGMRGADPLTSLHDNNPPSTDVITIGPPALGHVSADSGYVHPQLSPTHRCRRLDEAMFLPRGALRDSIMTRARLLTVQPEPDGADVISPFSQSLGANGFSGVLWRICMVMGVGNE